MCHIPSILILTHVEWHLLTESDSIKRIMKTVLGDRACSPGCSVNAGNYLRETVFLMSKKRPTALGERTEESQRVLWSQRKSVLLSKLMRRLHVWHIGVSPLLATLFLRPFFAHISFFFFKYKGGIDAKMANCVSDIFDLLFSGCSRQVPGSGFYSPCTVLRTYSSGGRWWIWMCSWQSILMGILYWVNIQTLLQAKLSVTYFLCQFYLLFWNFNVHTSWIV